MEIGEETGREEERVEKKRRMRKRDGEWGRGMEKERERRRRMRDVEGSGVAIYSTQIKILENGGQIEAHFSYCLFVFILNTHTTFSV